MTSINNINASSMIFFSSFVLDNITTLNPPEEYSLQSYRDLFWTRFIVHFYIQGQGVCVEIKVKGHIFVILMLGPFLAEMDPHQKAS